jgi:hypothetical protein
MLLFKILILAHIIADFPLQFDPVYRRKIGSKGGQLLHALIYLTVMMVLGYPLLGDGDYWFFVLLLTLAHLLIDSLKVRVFDRLTGPNNLWVFLFDQALHLVTIAAVFFTSLPDAAALEGSLLQKMDRAGVLGICIFLLIATFAGTFLLSAFKRTILNFPAEEILHDGFSKYYGIVERGIVFALIVSGGLCLFLVPAVMLARIPIANHYAKQFRYYRFLVSPSDVAASFLITLACAVGALLAA